MVNTNLTPEQMKIIQVLIVTAIIVYIVHLFSGNGKKSWEWVPPEGTSAGIPLWLIFIGAIIFFLIIKRGL